MKSPDWGKAGYNKQIPRFNNGQIGNVISSLDKIERTYDKGTAAEQSEFTIHRQ